jgi:hypothetical protein
MVLSVLKPDVIEQIMAGEIEGMKIGPELLLLYAILVLFPLVMAFLTLTLKDSINRWANIIVGAVFAAFFIDVIATVAKVSGEILMTLSTVVALVLIVWYAWKSKQKV